MMTSSNTRTIHRIGLSLFSLLTGVILITGLVILIRFNAQVALAAPIPPPEGYPKLSLSSMVVTPTLANINGATLFYTIEVRNTGAYAAIDTIVIDAIPAGATYTTGSAHSSVNPQPTFSSGVLQWKGNVAFDSSVKINFNVKLTPGVSGLIKNTATINQAQITKPVSVTAETMVTDKPIFIIKKVSEPIKPGPSKLLTYTLQVMNTGQPAVNLPVTVADPVPANTTFKKAGGGTVQNNTVKWTRNVTLSMGESSWFTYSVNIGKVPSGTVITNQNYQVSSALTGVSTGKVYTTTVINPILYITKQVFPDPPGSNREMTYTLTVLNKGSLATNLVVTDKVPAQVTYVRGGTLASGVVSWHLARLDTNQPAQFTFTVRVGDVKDVIITNDQYGVSSAEGAIKAGKAVTSTVGGPNFTAFAYLDPIAKKPGGGGGPVTPTLVIRNLGPGNALNVSALMEFTRISVNASDLYAIPAIGTPAPFPSGPLCGDNCRSYLWTGNINVGEGITFTTDVGQNSIGGEEGTVYTATIGIRDTLGLKQTEPITATATGKVTHFANLIPTKTAPEYVVRGQPYQYNIDVWNSGLSTDGAVWMTDTLPLSVTLVSVGEGGVSKQINSQTIISWTLPAMSPGDHIYRSFTVKADTDLVSGTQIVNEDYKSAWYQLYDSKVHFNAGEPVTTTVKESGLSDSYKEVTPRLALPGPGNVLTYYLHIVNSSNAPLTGIQVFDDLPWENSTYQRNAIASAGEIISDIVSINWTGDLPANSAEVISYTVIVDPDYEGPITNTAVIKHPSMLSEMNVEAVAYITTRPVLKISKSVSPGKVLINGDLLYTIKVVNLGQPATNLVVHDPLPANTQYVSNSATAGGRLENGQVIWDIPVMESGGERTLQFRVKVTGGMRIENANYVATCAEGVTAKGLPVISEVQRYSIFLPKINRN
ncbi:MAG: hypothetical protein ACM3PY_15245 [Omnitrophica WOR_2 bacterium]